VLVVCRDITREHFAKLALQELETELARVQAIGRIGGLEVDLRTGSRNRKSPEYFKIHGLPLEAVHESREDWLRRVHPDDRAVAEGQFIDAVRGGDREYAVRYRIIRPSDGETRWISARSVIERDAEGKAVRLFGAHIDVTDQVEAERSIRRREQEFRTLAEALPHHVWTTTSDGSFNWFNRRFYDYVGARPGELSGND
jgi:PAS domain S-box-containing protein